MPINKSTIKLAHRNKIAAIIVFSLNILVLLMAIEHPKWTSSLLMIIPQAILVIAAGIVVIIKLKIIGIKHVYLIFSMCLLGIIL